MNAPRTALAFVLGTALLLSGCGPGPGSGSGGRAALTVSTTTAILADLVRNVGGDRVDVASVVPRHGDPHSYEPSPGDAARVARSDLVLSNGLLLEEPGIMKMIHTNAPGGTPKVPLGERLEQYGGSAIRLTEDLGLDVLWLGWAVEGEVAGDGSHVRTTATALEGPGDLHVYLTDTLGIPQVVVDSTDGFGAEDSFTLPPEAHTHVNWAFSRPGTYRLTVRGRTETLDGRTAPIGGGTVTFVVGDTPAPAGRTVLDGGHADIALDTRTGSVRIRSDDPATGRRVHRSPDTVVLSVPQRAGETVPREEAYRFLGRPGAPLWVLPQAVLGRHVHGDTDPHTWEDVANAEAYVRRIEEELTKADPEGGATYRRNAARYLKRLAALDDEVARTLGRVPEANRRLITTHDAFGYLAHAYHLEIAGFVVPVPSREPSAAEIARLRATIRDREVPAVFVEPNLAARADVLRRVAEDEGVAVCTLYGDSFDSAVHDYVSMMRHNANELARCLGRERR
ncbi:anchored repeat ABC transporter, substrate-binding protein [Streptomyces sp. NPDC059695]|uniref:anchored repeat ABC transporter, substrate-binding protein n=1 Tax=Streptomyces sp. NPDC059695 TaxID=3346910 RepID=UPI0036C01E68